MKHPLERLKLLLISSQLLIDFSQISGADSDSDPITYKQMCLHPEPQSIMMSLSHHCIFYR